MSFVRAGITSGLAKGYGLLQQAASLFSTTKTSPPKSDLTDEFVIVKDPNKSSRAKPFQFFSDPLDAIRDADKILRIKNTIRTLQQYIADPDYYFSPTALHRYETRIAVIDLSDEHTLKTVLHCLNTQNKNQDHSTAVQINLHTRTVDLANLMLMKLDKILTAKPPADNAISSPRLT